MDKVTTLNTAELLAKEHGVSEKTIRRDGKTAKAGDTIWITVSVWQPIGSPTVYLAYDYKARDASGVYR